MSGPAIDAAVSGSIAQPPNEIDPMPAETESTDPNGGPAGNAFGVDEMVDPVPVPLALVAFTVNV